MFYLVVFRRQFHQDLQVQPDLVVAQVVVRADAPVSQPVLPRDGHSDGHRYLYRLIRVADRTRDDARPVLLNNAHHVHQGGLRGPQAP